MKCLDVGKTLEEGRHSLDLTADLETDLKSQGLDARDTGARAHHGARLQCECANAMH
jgi:hypothetical protein